MHDYKCLVMRGCILLLTGFSLIGSLFASDNSQASAPEPPFIIHYGLNDSHGRSWVRERNDGLVGITYFQPEEKGSRDGVLVYKTIQSDGAKSLDTVTSGSRLEKSVLLYDSLSAPHIFVARSNDTDQVIDHYFRNSRGNWEDSTIIHFYSEGGKFIYELSAEAGPDNSFHMLILKSRSDVDSDDFIDCWLGSYLYHLTNASGSWQKELVHHYDMAFTYDMCIKTSIRQDMKIDRDGFVHVTFCEQITDSYYPSRLLYATNRTGAWVIETVLTNTDGPTDDAGWFPSLCLDNNDVPHIACAYLNRVLTYSVMYSRLLLLTKVGFNDWDSEIVCEYDDGYHGNDGRDYTGALCHLVYDESNTPHIVFSDIAATHWDWQRMCVGDIRYGVLEDGVWNFITLYRQPIPSWFFDATEMLWLSMIVSDRTNTVRIFGQEIEVADRFDYECRMIEITRSLDPTDVEEEPGKSLPDQYDLSQNYPNPFNPETTIEFSLPSTSHVSIVIYNSLGRKVRDLVSRTYPAGTHLISWDGLLSDGNKAASGTYFYRLRAGDFIDTRKMILLK